MNVVYHQRMAESHELRAQSYDKMAAALDAIGDEPGANHLRAQAGEYRRMAKVYHGVVKKEVA